MSTHQTKSEVRQELIEKYRSKLPTALRMVLPVVGLFVLIWLLSYPLPDYIVPPLPRIASDYVNLLTNETSQAVATFVRIVYGILSGLVVGGTIGIVMGLNKRIRDYSETFIKFLTGVPGLSWVLLAVLWFQNIQIRIVFVLFMVIFPFYALNISDAIRGIPRDFSDMVKSFRFTYSEYVRKLVIPFLVPNILATSKTTIGYATRVVIVAELVGASVGVGKALLIARSNFAVSEIYAWTFILVTMMLALQGVITFAESTLLSWQTKGGDA
jgi:ABC-type nitrate/sulfonate/bicarbonate transport system permease component